MPRVSINFNQKNIMSNYKVKSSSCFGGNKVFYSGQIFTKKEVSEQDLIHLLEGGFVEATEEEATTGFNSDIVIIEKKENEESSIEETETEEKEIDPSELLKDKKPSKNSK